MRSSRRYARYLGRPEALRRKRVAIIGVGHVGGEVGRLFVSAGVGVTIVDAGHVKEENFGNQGLPAFVAVGDCKVQARARQYHELNPDCEVTPVASDVRDLGRAVFRDQDLLISCPDNLPARIDINDKAATSGTPWIDTGVDGSGAANFGRVSVYDSASLEQACYLCPHDSASIAAASKEAPGLGCPGFSFRRDQHQVPTVAVPALGAAVAAIVWAKAMPILVGDRAEVVGREWYVDLDAARIAEHRMRHNPNCLRDHRRPRLRGLGRRSQVTIADTFEIAGQLLGAPARLEVAGRPIVTALRCPGCGASRRVGRVMHAIRPEESRCSCGRDAVPGAFDLLDQFGFEDASAFAVRTWEEIGLPACDVVTARAGARAAHFVLE